MSSAYDSIRSAVLQTGSDSRVEVNQRALIDKILARYASAGAVYRELLQNSNDAEAKRAEVHFTTTQSQRGPVVTQVVYRNNGHPFRPQDWSRLRKIAEGNPDVSKVGAFGVGAYTMFSICEEPLVVSGGKALAFAWKGDALWVRLADSPEKDDGGWTTFVLKSRDLYPLPDLVDFGQFLCSSLTFTNCLVDLTVFVDNIQRLSISKRQVGEARVITPPKSSSWWSGDGAVTVSPKRIFSLGRSDGSITENIVEMRVNYDGDEATIQARYVSAMADTRVPSDMARRMVRVTKKQPPSKVKIEIFIDANSSTRANTPKRGSAAAITDAFSPRMGAGRVFIGFKTSQTTGLAAHLAAPLLPTVEREAIDLQDPTLQVYNSDLLAVAGILMRLTLEHSMNIVGQRWIENAQQRRAFEEEQRRKDADKNGAESASLKSAKDGGQRPASESATDGQGSAIFTFARFMSSGVKKIADVISSGDFLRDDDEDLLRPKDPRPPSTEEHDAIVLMRSFAPQQSTPDARIGAVIAQGFEMCFPGLSAPVLTKSGIARGVDSRLPHNGIEGFVEKNVVRSILLKNAETYLVHIAGCRKLSLQDLSLDLKEKVLGEEDLVKLLKWWCKYYRTDPYADAHGGLLKNNITFQLAKVTPVSSGAEHNAGIVPLRGIQYYLDDSKFSAELPMPETVLPRTLQKDLPSRVLRDRALAPWFSSFPFLSWISFVCKHPSMTAGQPNDAQVRLRILTALSQEYGRASGQEKQGMARLLKEGLSESRCIPFDGNPEAGFVTDFPRDLYLASAELDIFGGLGAFKKVSSAVALAGISEDFLLLLGVRKTISMEFLFSQLDSLKWNRNPKPLINYLRTVALTSEDLEKLRSTQYLPEAKDKSRPYAPFELYLPSQELEHFPFVKVLQWPATDSLHDRSPEWQFLKKVGCMEEPPLEVMIGFLKGDTKDERLRQHGLEYIYKRLVSGGNYERFYSRYMDVKFLPTKIEDPLNVAQIRKELHAPNSCFAREECKCLGFPILDLDQKGTRGRGYAQVFRVATQPSADHLVQQLLTVVSIAKSTLSSGKDLPSDISERILQAFPKIFRYMSSRAAELDKKSIDMLAKAQFIPLQKGTSIDWFFPRQVYFKNTNEGSSSLASKLFLVTEFNPFLATVGVKAEPSTEDLLQLLVSSPRVVLEKLGSEEKYRALLRRIAASSNLTITRAMRNAPFLLGFRMEDMDAGSGQSPEDASDSNTPSTTAKYTLAKAADICIIDNSFYSRLFNVLSAPQETDLERFYKSLGSSYISKSVNTRYTAVGGQRSNTEFTNEFARRLRERRPLLVSSIVASPLVSNAEDLLSDDQLDIYEVSKVKALYTYRDVTKTQYVTCAASTNGKKRLTIFVTKDVDWFHVGNAIGSVILVRCNVQDAFFIGSLLEAPLSQLRARGFPVDRILRASEPIEPPVDTTKETPNTVPAGHEKAPAGVGSGGFESILTQMFPDCNPAHIRKLLGQNPSLDSLRAAADTLANGNYPKVEKKAPSPSNPPVTRKPKAPQVPVAQPPQGPDHGKKPFSRMGSGNNVFSRAFRGLRGSSHNSGLSGMKGNDPIPGMAGRTPQPTPPSGGGGHRPVGHVEQDEGPDVIPDDVASQRGIKRVLESSVRSAQPVSANGLSTADQQVVSVPEKIEQQAGSCEVIPAQDLKPIAGPNKNGKTVSGVRVLASTRHAESEAFLMTNWSKVEVFAAVLLNLASIYSLKPESVAIFHEPTGRTIAFNAGRALHFNFRYFISLHIPDGQNPDADCYSFWFTTMAHELAHNLAIPHAKKHGFYTESYVHSYMPKLLELLSKGPH